MEKGTSHLYSRPCYGYRKDKNGELVIDDKKADNVRVIFDLYLKGHSILSIITELEKRNIKSPTCKDNWSKRSIETLLTNEKYVGDVIIGKTFCKEFPDNTRRRNKGERQVFVAEEPHEPIIQHELFEEVQQERMNRSNIRIVEGKTIRKDKRYSMKNSKIGD